MLVEDGRRLLISNEKLEYLAGTDWPSLDHAGERSSSTPAVEFRTLFPENDHFPLSTAARMSASFPYVSPAAVLPTNARRRVVDAGYFDDYGVDLAVGWLFHHARNLTNEYTKVLLIQVRDGLAEADRESPARPPDTSSFASRGTEEVISPVEAALAARESVMGYRNDRQLQTLDVLLNGLYGKDFFTTVLLENPAPVSMSWYVAEEELAQLEEAATHNPEIGRRLDAVKTWLRHAQPGSAAPTTG